MSYVARPEHAADPLVEALAHLRAYQAAKARDLNDEVSGYPTPIARCDDQLTKLLEQRARAMRALRLADEAAELAAADVLSDRRQRISQLLSLSEGHDDDDVEHALRRRVADELAGVHGSAV